MITIRYPSRKQIKVEIEKILDEAGLERQSAYESDIQSESYWPVVIFACMFLVINVLIFNGRFGNRSVIDDVTGTVNKEETEVILQSEEQIGQNELEEHYLAGKTQQEIEGIYERMKELVGNYIIYRSEFCNNTELAKETIYRNDEVAKNATRITKGRFVSLENYQQFLDETFTDEKKEDIFESGYYFEYEGVMYCQSVGVAQINIDPESIHEVTDGADWIEAVFTVKGQQNYPDYSMRVRFELKKDGLRIAEYKFY